MISAIVLAAGLARRFGSAKPLALYNGNPLVRCVVERFTGFDIVVVIPAPAADYEAALAGTSTRRVINERVDSGIRVRGIIEPGTTRCGSAIIAAMYAGERRSRTVVRSGPMVPPTPFNR